MSTAGKVLVVLIMLTAIGCLILAGGVAQLNANANQRLQQLAEELEKTQASVETTRQEVKSYRDQTTVAQEKIDREITALRSQQTDLERSRSQISETLSRLQYDLDTVNATITDARESLKNRITEFDNEQTAMANLRRHVQSLKTNNSELMGRLQSLRDKFQDTYHKNVEMLGKPR